MNKLRIAVIILLSCLYWVQITNAQTTDTKNPDLDPDNYIIDNLYFHIGTYYGLSQPVATDLKMISLSGPLDHDAAKTYEPVFKSVIERRGLKQYREPDFLVTDLFPEAYTRGKSVFIVYKYDEVIEDYLALKIYKQELIDAGTYDRSGRHEVATRFGKFLSYTDERIDENLKKNASQ